VCSSLSSKLVLSLLLFRVCSCLSMLLLEYAPVASISGIAWYPSYQTPGYPVTFSSDKVGAFRTDPRPMRPEYGSHFEHASSLNALLSPQFCVFLKVLLTQHPAIHCPSAMTKSMSPDRSEAQKSKRKTTKWATLGMVIQRAQRGTRTRSLEIRSLARYHCASRASVHSSCDTNGDWQRFM
jgi:hypothetical protein